jgi:hypothetical protein
MRSKSFLIGIATVIALFGLAGVAFVDNSHPVGAESASMASVTGDSEVCAEGAQLAKSGGGVPSSCAEVHASALAAGRMSKPQFQRAELALASAMTIDGSLTPDQCRSYLAELGYECNERDLLACAKRIQELGFCRDMTAGQCAEKLAQGICTGDPSECKDGQGGACCLDTKSKTTQISAGGNVIEVQPAVVKETTAQTTKPAQCDWTKGSCETADK